MNPALKRAIRPALVVAAVIAALYAAPVTRALGAPVAPEFQMPFPCGETWTGSTRDKHSPSYYSIDWNRSNDIGDPVVASAAGRADVRDAGNASYGKHIVINHGNGWTTLYAHLSAFSVADGATVRAGQIIGRLGSSGNSSGPHLHYEQKLGGDVVAAKFDRVPFRYPQQTLTSRNCGSDPPPDPGPSCSGVATLYGIVGESTLTVTQLSDPGRGGRRIMGAKVIGTLPFAAKTLVALDYNTLFATDGNNLYKVEVINFQNAAGSVRAAAVERGGWTHDKLAYDGFGHLYGIADGQLRRYNLAGGTYAVVSNTLLGASGWNLRTVTGAANEWLLATTARGELVSYDLNPVARHSLRPNTWLFTNLVSPGGGVYYAQSGEGALFHYVDRNPIDGHGADISAGRLIDRSGWTQRLLTAQPRVCT
jgi:Peptidase family M23/Tachylectin